MVAERDRLAAADHRPARGGKGARRGLMVRQPQQPIGAGHADERPGSGRNATYLARRAGTGSHYGTCMHGGTGLNGAAGPVSGVLMGIRAGSGANCPVQRGGSPGRGMPAGPEVPAVSSRMP